MKKNLKLVETIRVSSENDINNCHTQFLSEGYEGTIIRWGNEGYEINKRSKHLLKKKDFIDVTARIVDVISSEKRPEQGVLVIEWPGDRTCKASLKFSHAERKEILTNKANYIGQTAEIRFFEYTDDGLARFPVCVGFRLDK